MQQRPMITAHFRPERVRNGRPDTWQLEVPAIGRSTRARARRDGWLDRDDAEAQVRDLIVLWNGWDRDSFDVDLVEADR